MSIEGQYCLGCFKQLTRNSPRGRKPKYCNDCRKRREEEWRERQKEK